MREDEGWGTGVENQQGDVGLLVSRRLKSRQGGACQAKHFQGHLLNCYRHMGLGFDKPSSSLLGQIRAVLIVEECPAPSVSPPQRVCTAPDFSFQETIGSRTRGSWEYQAKDA